MTSARPNKLILVFPPFAMATSPPLGICALKGCIEKRFSDWYVQTLDLNLSTQEELLAQTLRGGALDKQTFPEGLLAEIALLRAAETFRGAHIPEFFDRPDRYSTYADLFLRFYEHTSAGSLHLERAYQGQAAMPQILLRQAQQIAAQKPNLIGISLCYSQQVWWAICLGKALRQISAAPVLFGGSFFIHEAERFLAEHRDACDGVVTGEGEHALTALLGSPKHPENTPGFTFLRGEKIVSNPPSFEEDLDLLGAPDYSDLDLRRYFSPLPVVPILFSRGCYWRRCTFCVHYRSAGMTYRMRSVEHVLTELRAYVDAGITNFAFIDEMISPNLFNRLADGILESGLRINYYALAKPVKQFSAKLLQRIAASGCRYLLWGVESGNQRVLDLMDKGTNVKDVEYVLEAAYAAGIRNHVYIIAGFPTETKEEYLETLCFLERHQHAVDAVHRGTFTLASSSPIFDQPEHFLLTIGGQRGDWRTAASYNFECASGLSREEVRELFSQSLPFLRGFNSFSRYLGNFRDHALLIYAKYGEKLAKKKK